MVSVFIQLQWFHLVAVRSIRRWLKQRTLLNATMLLLGWGLSVAIAACTSSNNPNATAVSTPVAVSPSPANLSDVTLLPTSDEAIASQQKVADTFHAAGVIPSKVDVKPLWDNTFDNAITKCSL